MTNSKVRLRFTLLAVLSTAGVIVSGILTRHFYMVRSGAEGFESYCNLGAKMNCDVVASSRYAELVAGIPLSSFAGGWFLAIAVIAMIGRASPYWYRDIARALLAMTAFSVLMTAIYFVIMAAVLKTYCLNCLITDGLNLLSFFTALSLWGATKPAGAGGKATAGPKVDVSRLRTLGWTTLAAMVFTLVAMRTMKPEGLEPARADRLIETVLASTPQTVTPGRFDLTISGDERSPVTVHEFLDFQCPSCRIGAQTVNTVIHRYGDRVRVVLRGFPLDPACNSGMKGGGHPAACEAARAAICAAQQGKLKAAYQAIFSSQESLVPGKPTALVRELEGIDESRLLGCMDAEETRAAVIADIAEGDRLGVRSTPTFFLNGRKMEGAMPMEIWVKVIDTLAAKAAR
jgi:protein-disulfide isomerase